jgi:DNA-binding XRE family transcriptional regulator
MNFLKAYRKRTHTTQEALARALGISQPTISHSEKLNRISKKTALLAVKRLPLNPKEKSMAQKTLSRNEKAALERIARE